VRAAPRAPRSRRPPRAHARVDNLAPHHPRDRRRRPARGREAARGELHLGLAEEVKRETLPANNVNRMARARAFFAAAATTGALALDNGFKLPAMGWSS